MGKIPPIQVIRRLCIYERVISSHEGDKISSKEIAELSETTEAQVRKDLSFFGPIGKPGYGYDRKLLLEHIQKILGRDKERKAVIAGVGKLGSALLRYPGFRQRGLIFVAAFDIVPSKIGRREAGVEIHHINELPDICKREKVEIGVITTPAEVAEQVACAMVKGGVKGILNFAPCKLNIEEVFIHSIDLSVELEVVSYFARNL